MKKYIKTRIIMYFEVIIIFTFIIFLNKSENNIVKIDLACNENTVKVVEKDIIQASQKELYNSGVYNPLYTFIGELTGYSGDCPLCTGYLACPPRTNVLKDGIYYDDKTYGKVRIVASSKNYPCGTILKFNLKKISDEPIIAIVLDRGVGGNAIDLLTESGAYAISNVGRIKNLEFEVLREGWTK